MNRSLKSCFNITRYDFKRNCSGKVASVVNILQTGNIGEEFTIKGWIKSIRKQKENVFIDLNDGSTDKKLQVLIPQSKIPHNLSSGSSISAEGVLSLSPKGHIEMSAKNIDIVGPCSVSDGYPIAPRKQYPPEYIRQYPHLRPRTSTFSSLLRVRSAAVLAIHNYFNSEGYTHIHTPILTSNDCEGAGEVFKVIPDNEDLLKQMAKENIPLEEAFFDRRVFLSVSGQLHLEIAAHGLNKVYTLGPTFRAENSRTRLHLSEFYMLEAEIAFLDSLEDLMVIIEKFMKNVTRKLIETCESDIEVCRAGEILDMSWLDKNFAVLSYDEAVNILTNNRNKFKEEFDDEKGISKEHEIFLVSYCGNIPTFIINWPKASKPFYMKEYKNDAKVAALDLLVPQIGEVVGGSLRENDYDKLKEKLPKNGTDLQWYLDLRKFGGVPTGGFGLGFERYLLFLLNIQNIKDTILVPRWPHNCNL